MLVGAGVPYLPVNTIQVEVQNSSTRPDKKVPNVCIYV